MTSFEEERIAEKDYFAVQKSRQIADAYVHVLHPLAMHQQAGTMIDMDTVASNIQILINHVDSARKKGTKSFFGDDSFTNQRFIKSIENRTVDAVIKARAAFVNVMENDFRKFGWPMKVPDIQKDASSITKINSYVNQLSQLQKVALDGDYIMERTKWQTALSDSWAIAAILRAPLARFKYHFLESFRSNNNQGIVSTARFDRPEWAADFALERIREATPFLLKINIDGPQSADVKFAEGFCRVFAQKVAYDCELALRTSTNDSDADSLIIHAAEIAKQFDAKLRSGVIQINPNPNEEDSVNPSFLSSLHLLSMNESFLLSWASSELRMAETEVSRILDVLLDTTQDSSVLTATTLNISQANKLTNREDLQRICSDVISHVGSASQKCRALESQERTTRFLNLTEKSLLQGIRSRLKAEIESSDFYNLTASQIGNSARASFCAKLFAEVLEDRALDPFYISQEKINRKGFYEEEVSKLRALHDSNSTLLTDAITNQFIDAIRPSYLQSTRFGDISAPDAAIVLTHDVSESLVDPLTRLESCLSAVSNGIVCRKSASEIWVRIAEQLDTFFFDEIVLQCFVGGSRNAMSVASEANEYLSPESCARMARQVACDGETLVNTFHIVTTNPAQFLPLSSECGDILRIAASRVLMPGIPPLQEDEEVLDSLKKIAKDGGNNDTEAAKAVLIDRLNVNTIEPREALELLAIGGLQFAIPTI